MESEDGQAFVKNLAYFVRTHEKALANALQLRRQGLKGGQSGTHNGDASPTQLSGSSTPSTSSALAAAFSLGTLNFSSHNIKPAKLTLTPHHLFYLLSCFEEVGIPIGPMNVRLESLRAEASPANYVSFLSQTQRSKGRSDRDSIHSVSSVRSVMSGMSSLWSNLGLGGSSSASKGEKAKAQQLTDTKYLYSAFTKIPCLRLSPDRKARLIGGYEEFPFDTAVPLFAFKNLNALELSDVDFRQFFGWDRLAEQLRSLTLKRANMEDPIDLLVGIVLDDMDKRRRRSSKAQYSPVLTWPSSSFLRHNEITHTSSIPGSPSGEDRLSHSTSPRKVMTHHTDTDLAVSEDHEPRPKSTSPSRPSTARPEISHRHMRGSGNKMKRSGSGSSNSSDSTVPYRNGSFSNLLSMGILPASKWRFLRHLSLADNSFASMSASSLAPLANTLHSLDLSSNLFAEIPDCLASLTALKALNLSHCMIDSVRSLARSPLPAITALNLRSNRLSSIAGIERLCSLERLDLRDNKLQDPTELARLTGMPQIREIWVVCNPFTKTHGNYRVSIFNLFRGTPGYSEDISVDAMGPTYGERRQLRDRVAQSEAVPIVKPLPLKTDTLDAHSVKGPSFVTADDLEAAETERTQRPLPRSTQSEMAIGSGRRKRGPRRRIVDLAGDDTLALGYQASLTEGAELAPSAVRGDVRIEDANGISPKTRPALPFPIKDQPSAASAMAPTSVILQSSPSLLPATDISDKGQSLAHEIKHLNFTGETYRQKVEALKTEVGSDWLSVLSEEACSRPARIERTLSTFPQSRTLRPELSDLRVQSQGIVSGSRTLG